MGYESFTGSSYRIPTLLHKIKNKCIHSADLGFLFWED